MIAYSNMTLRQAYEEVVLRAGQHRTGINFDWDSIVMFVNRAIREVMLTTLPYKDWAYSTKLAVADATILPQRFLKKIRVLLSAAGTAPYDEAREMSVREFWTISDLSGRQHAWNRSVPDMPTYMLWAEQDANGISRLRIEVAPAGHSGIMECYVCPADLTADTDIVSIPYEFEDMVVLLAMSRLFAKTDDKQFVMTLHGQIVQERQRLLALFEEKRMTEKREMDNFLEPAIPVVQPEKTPGEANTDIAGKTKGKK